MTKNRRPVPDVGARTAAVTQRVGPPLLPGPPQAQHIWLVLEPTEIIELKQVVMDRDTPGAVEFFYRVIVPRVRAAARQRGLATDWNEQADGANDGYLPG